MRKKNFVKLSKKPLTIKEYNRLNSEIARNNRLGRQKDFDFIVSNAKQQEQLELMDYLLSLDVRGLPSNKNLTSEDYFHKGESFDDFLEQQAKEDKMYKILAIGGFIGGLLTAIVGYTCDFFGITFDDTKPEINVSSEVENGKI